jgi:5-formyltetrahydrofolate cyclo-ligase
MNHPSDEKARLREKLLKIRSEVGSDLAETASRGVWAILSGLPEFKRAKTLAAFASVPGEIDTLPILEGVLKGGKSLSLPKVLKDKTHFEFYPVQDLKDLSPGAYGILEPTASRPTGWESLDLVLVPGLAFDPSGRRLGFGKGYYDRALPLLPSDCLTVGLGYGFQVVERVPTGPQDIPVKALLTEKGFINCKTR